MSIPVILDKSGRQNTPPATLNQQLISLVAGVVPGYTAVLPGSLIEDISSTDTYALALIDAAVTETINSLTPLGANNFLLNQLGQIYGVPLGQGSTTSVYIEVSGPPGFNIPVGFTVSDGTYQYVVQDGGAIGAGAPTGNTIPLYCLSTTQGSWAVPPGTVTQIISSVPTGYTLAVTNPQPGTPGTAPQTPEDYRAQVLTAGRAISTGMTTTIKARVGALPGVQTRLLSVRQATSAGWSILVGGGDPYQIAGELYRSVADISLLVGSLIDTGRNTTVSIIDPPDTYAITFINPPEQTVGLSVIWNTSATNLVSNAAVASLATPALVAYINSIVVGQPINVLQMQEVFQQAVAPLVPTSLLIRLVFFVTIGGLPASPLGGTGEIEGDPESYFYTTSGAVTISQG